MLCPCVCARVCLQTQRGANALISHICGLLLFLFFPNQYTANCWMYVVVDARLKRDTKATNGNGVCHLTYFHIKFSVFNTLYAHNCVPLSLSFCLRTRCACLSPAYKYNIREKLSTKRIETTAMAEQQHKKIAISALAIRLHVNSAPQAHGISRRFFSFAIRCGCAHAIPIIMRDGYIVCNKTVIVITLLSSRSTARLTLTTHSVWLCIQYIV